MNHLQTIKELLEGAEKYLKKDNMYGGLIKIATAKTFIDDAIAEQDRDGESQYHESLLEEANKYLDEHKDHDLDLEPKAMTWKSWEICDHYKLKEAVEAKDYDAIGKFLFQEAL